MMKASKQLLILLLLCLVSMPVNAYTERDLLQKQTDISRLKPILILNQKWVPYPDYSDRTGWDNFLGDWKNDFISRGEKRLGYDWKVIKATDYMEFSKSGNRRIMEDPLNENTAAVIDLFLAELAEGKGRFTGQLINGVYQACEMTSWALSAHLINQSTRKPLPDYREQLIDLFSGDLSSIFSWVHYFFREEFDKVDPSISSRIRYELKTRTMDPYMNQDNFWWMAVNYKPGAMVNNWNPWCNFNVLQTFMLMENDPDKLAAGVYRSMVSVDKFINYTHSDGACEEGPAYWGHAAGKLYDYLQLLSDLTGGQLSIFDQPIIKNMGEYIVRSYVGNDWVVNFADASAKGGGNAPLIYRYGKAVNSNVMKSFAAYQESKSGKTNVISGRDLFRTFQGLLYAAELASAEPVFTTPRYTWYPETEFCYMTNKNGFFVATKGGYNNESHNHNDIGTFSLYLNTTPIFIDAGVGTYTRQTFSRERYNIWTMQSNYHNLPMINGTAQAFGSEYKATQVSFNPNRMTFTANIGTAYPEQANVYKWTRSYTLNNSELKITDDFVLTETASPNIINFLVWGEVDVDTPGVVTVQVNDEKAGLAYDKDKFTVSLENIILEDPRLSGVWSKQIYRVSLTAKEMVKNGKYTFSIRKIK